MSSGKKGKGKKSTQPAISQEADLVPVPQDFPIGASESAEAPAPATAQPAAEQTLTLQDVARRWVAGWNDRWWPSVAAFAATSGRKLTGTEAECKACLTAWGAKLK